MPKPSTTAYNNCKKIANSFPNALDRATYLDVCSQNYGVDPKTQEGLMNFAAMTGTAPNRTDTETGNSTFMEKYGVVLIGLGVFVLLVIIALVGLSFYKKGGK